jgi:hypothetical protein
MWWAKAIAGTSGEDKEMNNEMIEKVAIAIAKHEQPDKDYISLNKFGKAYYRDCAEAE